MLLNISVNMLWHQSLYIQPLQDDLQMPWEDPLEEKGGSWKNILSSTKWVCFNRDYRGLRERKLTRIIQSFLWLRTEHDVLNGGPFPTLCCRCSAVTTHSKSNLFVFRDDSGYRAVHYFNCYIALIFFGFFVWFWVQSSLTEIPLLQKMGRRLEVLNVCLSSLLLGRSVLIPVLPNGQSLSSQDHFFICIKAASTKIAENHKLSFKWDQ